MSNRKEIYYAGHMVFITRRFLNKETGKMRVRVKITNFARTEVVCDEYHDFDDMHTGDTAYSKQIKRYTNLGMS
jgi:hypothetical protein